MPRFKMRITLSDGKTIWLSGANAGDAFKNAFEQLNRTNDQQQIVKRKLKDYAE